VEKDCKLDRTSLLKSGGVLPISVCLETGKLTNGPSLRRRSLALVGVGMDAVLRSVRHTANALSRSLAHLKKREISEKKWAEAKRWAAGQVTGRKYTSCRPSKRPDKTVADSSKRLASRFHLPAEDGSQPNQSAPEVGGEPAHSQTLVVPVQDPDQVLPAPEMPAENLAGR